MSISPATAIHPERQPLALSVVIATLGGDMLRATLDMLNGCDHPPAEILICIPEPEAARVPDYGHANVRIIATPCRGQVAQRAYGLARVSQQLTMQMDDDIIVSPDSIARLRQALDHLGPGSVVAPLFRHTPDGPYITHHPKGLRAWLNNVYLSLVCGAPWGSARMGKLTSAGMGYWVDRDLIGDAPFETEWIPGGCAMCRTEDLVTDSYFPFPGKAFSEDLIHSIYWRRQGARLWAIPTAHCSTAVEPMPFVWRLMVADLRAHAHVVRLIDGSLFRLYAWFAVFLAKQTVFSAWRAVRSIFSGARLK